MGLMKSPPRLLLVVNYTIRYVYHMMNDDAFPVYLSATPNVWLGVYIDIWFCMVYMCERRTKT